jgi:glycosyltransferase involved in cell wall biosynthesis
MEETRSSSPGPSATKLETRVAVVTPYHSAPEEWLQQCIASVRAQTHPCDQILVCDGVEPPACGGVRIFRTPLAHRDHGDTPRALGSITAFRLGYDAVTWLDDDNWYAPDHVETMVRTLGESGAQVVTCTRLIATLEGKTMGPCTDTDPRRFIDTNCYLIDKSVPWVVNKWWMMAPDLHLLGDRAFLAFLQRSGVTMAHTGKATVHYRTQFGFHYERYGFPVPAQTRPNPWLAYREKYGKDPVF